MRKVRHRNVVQFIGACTQKPNLCIVFEFMAGGSIFDHMRKVGSLCSAVPCGALPVASYCCLAAAHGTGCCTACDVSRGACGGGRGPRQLFYPHQQLSDVS